MKKNLFFLAISLSVITLHAQPIFVSDSLKTGHIFNLYALTGVNIADISPVGANVTWNISTATATLAGTAEFQDMAATPHAATYPMANFAMKFTMGATTNYSLFIKSNTKLEEVANNVGTTPTDFIDYRNALVFPFTYGMIDNDSYQKTAQTSKTLTLNYSGYGTFITSMGANNNTVQCTITDDGNTSVHWWNSVPLVPLLQASGSGFILWQISGGPTGMKDYSVNPVFDMYPNPAENTLHIINKELVSKLEIYDITGKLMFSTSQSVIDISNLPAGTYAIKAYTEKAVVSEKFIKK